MDDFYYLQQAAVQAANSPDPSTQNGSCLVCASGNIFCGFNRPTVSCDLLNRDIKMKYMEHAERNVLFQAAKSGVSTANSILYCIWFACDNCARAIVECGVTKVIGSQLLYESTPARWKQAVEDGLNILKRGGVEVVYMPDMLGVEILFNGSKLKI